MEKTIKDLSKAGTASYGILKKAVYYGFIPMVIILGLRTVKLEAFTGPQ